MTSVGSMVKQLAGLVDTKDLSDWEQSFVSDIDDRTAGGNRTSHLSEKQIERIESIYRKHFG